MGACSSKTKKSNDPQKKADTSSGKEPQKQEEKKPEAGDPMSQANINMLVGPPIIQDPPNPRPGQLDQQFNIVVPQIQEVADDPDYFRM